MHTYYNKNNFSGHNKSSHDFYLTIVWFISRIKQILYIQQIEGEGIKKYQLQATFIYTQAAWPHKGIFLKQLKKIVFTVILQWRHRPISLQHFQSVANRHFLLFPNRQLFHGLQHPCRWCSLVRSNWLCCLWNRCKRYHLLRH